MTAASPVSPGPAGPSARATSGRIRRVGTTVAVAAGVLAGIAVAPAAHADPVAPVAPAAAAPTVSADALPTVQVNGTAWSQVVVGNTVYVAGSFTSARPAGSPAGTGEVPREYLLAYDIRTGELIQSFHHVLNAEATVITASPDGTRVYVGGKFTTIDGINRYRLAAFDVATGNLVTAFKPVSNASVGAIAATNTAVYFGGAFGNVNGVARTRAAAVTSTTGALLTWAPTIDTFGTNTMVLTPDGTGVVLGGRFSSVNGQPAYGSTAVDAVTGATRPWALNQTIKGSNTAGTLTLSTDGTLIYGGNYTLGNGNFEGTWAADPSTGAIVWANDCLGDTYGVTPVNGVLYTTGHAHNCGAVGAFPETNPRSWHFALAFDTAASSSYNSGPDAYGNNFSAFHTSSIRQWYPTFEGSAADDSTQAGWSVAGNADYVVYAGAFPRVDNTDQQGLVRFASRAIAPNAYGPTGLGVPTATSTTDDAGTSRVTVTAQGAYDRDDATLRYDLYRSGVTAPVATTTAPSTGFWTKQANVTLTDATAPSATALTYTLTASDPSGRRLHQSVAVTTAAVPAPPAPPAPPAASTWTPQAGAVSSRGSYRAAVGTTTLVDRTLTVPFTATGSFLLPGPSGSCLKVGTSTVNPTSISLTTSQWGRYVGTVTYTLAASGTYAFQYGCRSDFSKPVIGAATIPAA